MALSRRKERVMEAKRKIEPTRNGVTAAICLFGLSTIARRCGVSHQAVRRWEADGISLERVPDLEAATDYRITRFDLRPDHYGDLKGEYRRADPESGRVRASIGSAPAPQL